MQQERKIEIAYLRATFLREILEEWLFSFRRLSGGPSEGKYDAQSFNESKIKEECNMQNEMKKKANPKKFVRYKAGADMYSMCQTKFEKMAKEAGAVYKVNKIVLVNTEIFEAYLETFRLERGADYGI